MDSTIPQICLKVFNYLGVGYKENIYQRALEIEFQRSNIVFNSEVICPIYYNNISIGHGRADIVLYDEGVPISILELKAQTANISKKEFIQITKYFNSINVTCGYVINFMITSELLFNKNNLSKYLEIYKINLNDNNLVVFKYDFINNNFKKTPTI